MLWCLLWKWFHTNSVTDEFVQHEEQVIKISIFMYMKKELIVVYPNCLCSHFKDTTNEIIWIILFIPHVFELYLSRHLCEYKPFSTVLQCWEKSVLYSQFLIQLLLTLWLLHFLFFSILLKVAPLNGVVPFCWVLLSQQQSLQVCSWPWTIVAWLAQHCSQHKPQLGTSVITRRNDAFPWGKMQLFCSKLQ